MEGLPINVPKSFSGLLSFSRESVSASLSRAEASLGLRTNGIPTTNAAASTPGAASNGTPPPNSKPLSSASSNTNSSVSSTSTSHQRLNNPSRYLFLFGFKVCDQVLVSRKKIKRQEKRMTKITWNLRRIIALLRAFSST